MTVPKAVAAAMDRLEAAGFACHAVGGCVRDSLLGREPNDWDLTTDALPHQVIEVFDGERVIPTGVRHGTVTVVLDGLPLEITTYRVEGDYRDHRHPESVRFVREITEDLRRRDFTVNAMAWNARTGLCDPFGGADDLAEGCLRCVGDAEERFSEDALRVLRALRFAATYGFAIEPATEAALFSCAPLLCEVAPERLQAELNRLLTGAYAGKVLRRWGAVLFPLLPELQAMVGVQQCNPYHDKDVWEHTVAALEASSPLLSVRLTLLLHDCGKPFCFEWLDNGYGHFPEHPAVGEKIARRLLQRLRYDRETTETVCTLVRHHDDRISDTDAGVRRCLCSLGAEGMRRLLDVKEGDCRGHAPSLPTARREGIVRLRARMERVIAEGQCFTLAQLAVNGDDLQAAGLPRGKAVGVMLHRLLDAVVDGELPNERTALLSAVSSQKDLIISEKTDTIEQ